MVVVVGIAVVAVVGTAGWVDSTWPADPDPDPVGATSY